jgi:2-iminobutanoate/2-iminopropanoate deaminase
VVHDEHRRAVGGFVLTGKPTLTQYKTDVSHVVMERIYTTDMEPLIRSQETRNQVYGNWLPAATWVEVRRLYAPADKIEIEVQVALD